MRGTKAQLTGDDGFGWVLDEYPRLTRASPRKLPVATRLTVNAQLGERPGASLEETHCQFFRDCPDPVPIRIISGHNVEAAGTKTVQILFEGHYNGYFAPDVHYIPLKKDFSNIDDVMGKFRDAEYCRRVVENAYEVAVSELTYPKLIDKFHTALVSAL